MSTNSFHSANLVPTYCLCGLPVAHKQSWTSRNPGRRFVTCKFYNPSTGMNGCGTFAWVDEHQEEWQRVIVNQLVLEKKLLERQVEALKLHVCNIDDQKNKVEQEVSRLKLRCHRQAGRQAGSSLNLILVGVIVILLCLVLVLY